jgi:hypothetical protein
MGAIPAGEAFVKFTMKDAALRKSLGSLEKRAHAIAGAFNRIGKLGMAAGAAVTTSFAGAAALFAKTGSDLATMSSKTGLSVESLQKLGYAAEQAGADMSAIKGAGDGVRSFMLSLREGSSDAFIQLARLGVKFDDLASQSPDQQMQTLLDAVAGVEDPLWRAAAATKVFGGAGESLLPILNAGPDALAKLTQRADEWGTMSEADVAAAAELGSAMKDLWHGFQRGIQVVGAAVAGPLATAVTIIRDIAIRVYDWVEANRPLIQTALFAGMAIFGVGAALVAAGAAFSAAGFVAAGLSTAIGVVGAVMGAILSPIGLVVAAIAGGTVAFATMTETGQKMTESLGAWLGELSGTVMTAFGAIRDALAAGDIEAAGDVLWAALKLLWLQGTQGLREMWHSLTGAIVKAWHIGWAGVQTLASTVWGNLERGWSYFAEFIATVFDTAVTNVCNLWTGMVTFMQRGLNGILGFFQYAWAYITGATDSELDRIKNEVFATDAILRDQGRATVDERNSGAADRAAERNRIAAAERESSRAAQAAVLDEIGAELARKLEGADDGTRAKIEAALAEVEAAKSRFNTATEAAAAAAKAAEEEAKKKAKGVGSGADGGMRTAEGKFASQGTFSAAVAALSFGSNGVQKDMLGEMKRMRESSERQERKKLELPRAK